VRGLIDETLTGGVYAVLDRRLAVSSTAPLAVALSGGGDSLALALLAADWAKARGRRLLILTVDHRLNPQSADWTKTCAAHAARLAVDFQALAWDGDKPARGLPAAARAARHRLLAGAARKAGARVILMAHTASDIAEAAAMRVAGSTTPSPREWAPSPVWPEGRGVFLLRPMLHLARGEIRAWLAARGQTWIEDPANADLRFARARARAAGADLALPEPAREPPPMDMEVDAAGVVSLPRMALTPRALAVACLCAAGAERPPRAERLARIVALAATGAPFVATLAGARIEARAGRLSIMREPGELVRRPPAPLILAAGEAGVWDGRFEIAADRPARIVPLAGLAARLPPLDAAALREVPAKARAALPAEAEAPSLRIASGEGLAVRCLVEERLLAALGVVDREPAA
jgi:tRNA(Ile)-lysidine synthase